MSQEKFWVVWNPSASAPRHRHDALYKAEQEALRLAAANPGEEFIVLESIGTARTVSAHFSRHIPVIPF